MTLTDLDADVVTLIGEAAGALLPADEGWTLGPADAGLPPGKTAAVGAQVGDHVIAVVVAQSMDRRIQVGPPPADGLLDGITPAIEAVAQVLGLGAPGETVSMNPQAVAAGITEHTVVAALLDGDQHLVSVLVTPPAPDEGDDAEHVEFQPIVAAGGPVAGASGLEILHEVQMGVTVELGRTRMSLRDILSIVPGSVIELDRAASAPVDVLVNGTLVARGEVVVIDEEFGLRVTEVIGHDPIAGADHP